MAVYYNAKAYTIVDTDLSENVMNENGYYSLNLIKLDLKTKDRAREDFWLLESNGCEIVTGYSTSKINSESSKYIKVVSRTKVEKLDEVVAYLKYVNKIIEISPHSSNYVSVNCGGTPLKEKLPYVYIIERLDRNNIPLAETINYVSYDECLENVNVTSDDMVVNIDIKASVSYSYSFYDKDDIKNKIEEKKYSLNWFYPFVSNMFILCNFSDNKSECLEKYRDDWVDDVNFVTIVSDTEKCVNPFARKFRICDFKKIPGNLINLSNINQTMDALNQARAFVQILFNENGLLIDSLKEKAYDEVFVKTSDLYDEISDKLLRLFKDRDDLLQERLDASEEEKIKYRNNVTELFKRMDMLSEDSRFAKIKEDFFSEIGIATQSNFLEFQKSLEKSIRDINSRRQEVITFSNKIEQSLVKKQGELESKSRDIAVFADNTLNSMRKELEVLKSQLISELNKIELRKSNMILEITEQVVREVIKRNPVQEININLGDDDIKRKVRGIYHESFKEVLQLIYLKTPVFLVGPAGCGKNVMLKQAAKVLDLQFYYINDAREKYDLLGFVDAKGKYQETQFFKTFTKGGLLMIDELDSADASVLLLLNSALGTGDDFYMTFPDGNHYQAHPDFHLVAAANTFGTGSNQTYNGRNQLDGASLNRFLAVEVDYDTNIEKTLVNNLDILPLYWEVRRIIRENEINYVVSTRNILNADKYLNAKTFSLDKIFKWTLVGSMTEFDLGVIISNIKTTDKYSRAFIEFVKKNYNIEEAREKSKTRTRTRNSYDYGNNNDDSNGYYC